MAGNTLQARLRRHGQVILTHLLPHGRRGRVGFHSKLGCSAKNKNADDIRKNHRDGQHSKIDVDRASLDVAGLKRDGIVLWKSTSVVSRVVRLSAHLQWPPQALDRRPGAPGVASVARQRKRTTSLRGQVRRQDPRWSAKRWGEIAGAYTNKDRADA